MQGAPLLGVPAASASALPGRALRFAWVTADGHDADTGRSLWGSESRVGVTRQSVDVPVVPSSQITRAALIHASRICSGKASNTGIGSP